MTINIEKLAGECVDNCACRSRKEYRCHSIIRPANDVSTSYFYGEWGIQVISTVTTEQCKPHC